MLITVDVDEEGYLRHESSSSEGSGTGSDIPAEDEEAFIENQTAYITVAIQKALRPHRPASQAIKVLWTAPGS
eukprot:5993801-Prymnesium_polylepis.1